MLNIITSKDLLDSLSTKNVNDRWKSRTYSQWMSCVPDILRKMSSVFMSSYDYNQKDAYYKAVVAGIVKVRRIHGIPSSEEDINIYRLATQNPNKGWGVLEQGIGCEGAYIDGMIDEIQRLNK